MPLQKKAKLFNLFLVCTSDPYTKIDGTTACGILLGGKLSYEDAARSCQLLGAEIFPVSSERENEQWQAKKVTHINGGFSRYCIAKEWCKRTE